MLIKCTEHLEALPVVHQPFVFKEEMQGTILNSYPDLALPISTGFGIPGVSDESII